MSIKQRNIIGVFIFGMGLLSLNVQAQSWSLVSQPTKCVSLKRGHVCYQDIRMKWQAPQAANYCLVKRGHAEPLKCWSQLTEGKIHFEFAETESQQYVLRRQGETDDLATAVIEIKWVYKARRKRDFGWRLF